jgi:hypothetical protein
VPSRPSEAYVEAAVAAGAQAQLVRVDGDQFEVVDPGSPTWARTLAILGALG